jgi:hypothetical protein
LLAAGAPFLVMLFSDRAAEMSVLIGLGGGTHSLTQSHSYREQTLLALAALADYMAEWSRIFSLFLRPLARSFFHAAGIARRQRQEISFSVPSNVNQIEIEMK